MVKLLIVDDDISFSNQLKHALEQKNYQCFELNSPEHVVDTIKRDGITIVLLDVMMPRNSGFELCRQIRINRDVYNTGIIFLSAMNDPEEIEHGFSQGGDDYLVKPISLSLLLSRLNTLATSIENT
ncbi:MAG: response regulator, partial [Candidatus Hydrogenedens sp.]